MFQFDIDTEVGSIEALGEITYGGRKATYWDPEEGPEGEVRDINLIVTDGDIFYDVAISEKYAIELVGGIRPWLRLVEAALVEGLEGARESSRELDEAPFGDIIEDFEPIYEYDIPW